MAAYNFKDRVGQKFGRLTVMSRGHTEREVLWWCLCDCGNGILVYTSNLRNGNTQSCGCLNIEKSLARIQEWHKEDRTGSNSSNWNPSLTDEERETNRDYPEYVTWRIAVYKRDMHTCQKCGDSSGGNLNAHHVESYTSNPELRTELSNGITLCKRCHLDFHHQYGYGNNTRKQLEEFLNKNRQE